MPEPHAALAQWCEVILGTSVKHVLPDGSEVPESSLYGLDGLSVTWGRQSIWDQPEGSTVTLDVVLGPYPWPAWVATDLLTVGAPVAVRGSVGAAPAAGAHVFVGTITDVVVTWDDGWTSARATVTAVDASRQAQTDTTGDVPFPQEAAPARLVRLEALASTGMWADAAPGSDLASVILAWQDVDAQAWSDLVATVAITADAVAWPVYGPDPATGKVGPGYSIERTSNRPSTVTLHVDPGGSGLVIVGPAIDPPAAFTDLSACWTARAGVEWGRTVSTMVTRVSVSWSDVVAGAEGNEATERTVTLADADREAVLGVQGASIGTELATAAAAQAMAMAVLARSTIEAWAVTGIELDGLDPATAAEGVAVTDCMTLMRREGRPISVTDMPAWSPWAGGQLTGFVEGGTVTFAGGRWLVAIVFSSIGGTGTPARWQDFPATAAYQWQDMAPDVAWLDAAVPVEV